MHAVVRTLFSTLLKMCGSILTWNYSFACTDKDSFVNLINVKFHVATLSSALLYNYSDINLSNIEFHVCRSLRPLWYSGLEQLSKCPSLVQKEVNLSLRLGSVDNGWKGAVCRFVAVLSVVKCRGVP